MKLVSTKFTDLVPVEQFNHKPMGMYDGAGNPRVVSVIFTYSYSNSDYFAHDYF